MKIVNKIVMDKIITVYRYLAEIGDRRTAFYKKVSKMEQDIEDKYGKESKELNDFYDSDIQDFTNKAI